MRRIFKWQILPKLWALYEILAFIKIVAQKEREGEYVEKEVCATSSEAIQFMGTKRHYAKCLKPRLISHYIGGSCIRPKPMLVVKAASSHSEGPIKKLGLSDAECEAAVVAGNVPEAPPVPPVPASPPGTPLISSFDISRRPRRIRRSPVLRSAFQETSLSPANFVCPLFIHEGEEDVPIGAMPGCYRLGWRHGLLEEVLETNESRKKLCNAIGKLSGMNDIV